MDISIDLGNPALSIEAGDHQTVIPDFEIDTLARCLLPKMQAYFASPEGQAAFEAWRRNKNHKEGNE